MDKIKRDKKELRKQILQKRSEFPGDVIIRNSNVIIDKIKEMEAFIKGKVIMCYIDFGNEVRTQDFIRFCLKTGKRVLVPFIIKYPGGKREMKASELLDLDLDVESGTMGVLEPKLDKFRFVDPSEIDFFVVPGLAFDIARNRLGYGAGFHDSVLRLLRKDCETVAVAFDFQVFDKIPIKVYDVAVKKIVTESRIIE